MKKYLYVDTENTGLSFINIVNRMGSSWHVSIFYSDKSPKLSFAELDLLNASRCRVKYRHCRNGRPNAIDFCIMTQLGMSVRKHPNAIHLVLSRDKGYLSGIEMLRDKGYFVGEIVMDEATGSFGWVSETADEKPYAAITNFMDGLGMPGAGETQQILPAPGGKAGQGAAPAAGGARSSEPKYMTEQALEKQFVRILMSGFESVGVDRKRKCLGQVVRKGLHTAYMKGELNLEQLEYHIRKLASFRGSPARTQRFLQAVSEIPDLIITGAEKTLLGLETDGTETGTAEDKTASGAAETVQHAADAGAAASEDRGSSGSAAHRVDTDLPDETADPDADEEDDADDEDTAEDLAGDDWEPETEEFKVVYDTDDDEENSGPF